MALATENSIILQNLDFAASGSYSCEVSMDTPIYTKASTEKQLTVFRKYLYIALYTFSITDIYCLTHFYILKEVKTYKSALAIFG